MRQELLCQQAVVRSQDDIIHHEKLIGLGLIDIHSDALIYTHTQVADQA